MASTTEIRTVTVPGGDLEVAVDSGRRPVLAIHGVSSNRRLFDWLRARAPELPLIVPDLRGRGGSVAVDGPFSVRRHAADLVAVLDALGLDAVDVCGMSMGGFVAVELATSAPDRVRSVCLVDGGLPMVTPPGLTRDLLPRAFAAQLGRLDQDWPDPAAYREYFLRTSPLLDPADPLLTDYLAHDLAAGRIRLNPDALLADAESIFFDESPWRQLTAPAELLCAQWSVGPDSAPAYPDDRLPEFTAALPTLAPPRRLAGLDHAGTIMTAAGAAAVAESLGRLRGEPLSRSEG
jgi:pimeloyl-ACP methyl ester carboxylesterase